MSASSARASVSSTELTGEEKLADVTKMIETLGADLEKISLLPQKRDVLLEQLKVYGRDPAYADPIFTKTGIEVLSRHAFNSPSKITSRNALRCLANALLLKPDTRQIFVDLGYEARICAILKDGVVEDEFLVSRIVFLTTYDKTLNIENLLNQHHLADIISQNIGNHAKHYTSKQKGVKELDPMDDMALIESMKLFFNLTHLYPEGSKKFSQALPHILQIIQKRPVSPTKPLDLPIAQLINSLLNIPLEDPGNTSTLFPKGKSQSYLEKFVELLDLAINVYRDDELEQLVSPLLTAIRKLLEIGPPEIKEYLQSHVLPNDKDREEPIGKGESLSARLLRLSSDPTAPQVRESISAMFFELSDKDATTFVQNIGYGFASGFLFQHKVPIPQNAFEAFSTGDAQSSSTKPDQDNADRVNPITGQRVDTETKVDMPEMTQEEKEREAERLFVLFDRLQKNGVISVKNPMEEALHQGRFEELPDDAESD